MAENRDAAAGCTTLSLGKKGAQSRELERPLWSKVHCLLLLVKLNKDPTEKTTQAFHCDLEFGQMFRISLDLLAWRGVEETVPFP